MLSNIKPEKIEFSDRRFHGIGIVIEVESSTHKKHESFWRGRVKFRGSQWNAKSLDPCDLEINDTCLVMGVTSDVILVIEPYLST